VVGDDDRRRGAAALDREADAKAERPEAARTVEVGGRGGSGWTGTCGGRPPAAGKRDCGAVAVRFVADADGCGAVGCRTERPVYEVEKESGATRVLCADHIDGWVRR
jgi:hypothetical protein